MDLLAEKKRNVVEELLRENGGWAVIDGGLATELESKGADIKDALWSSKCLFSCPQLITKAFLLFACPFLILFFSLFPNGGSCMVSPTFS
jgi:Homocysteine S-methyltransferase